MLHVSPVLYAFLCNFFAAFHIPSHSEILRFLFVRAVTRSLKTHVNYQGGTANTSSLKRCLLHICVNKIFWSRNFVSFWIPSYGFCAFWLFAWFFPWSQPWISVTVVWSILEIYYNLGVFWAECWLDNYKTESFSKSWGHYFTWQG